MALLTASQLAAILSIPEADIPATTITIAESRVKKLLSKEYATVEYTHETMLHSDQEYLKLPHQNIIAVSSFTIEDVDEDGLSEADDEFSLFKEEGIVYCTALTTFKKIELTYTYGACTVDDLDKYLHSLIVLKMVIISKPGIITKESISEKIGDYSVKFNVADLQNQPQLIDDEINKVVNESDENSLYFL